MNSPSTKAISSQLPKNKASPMNGKSVATKPLPKQAIHKRPAIGANLKPSNLNGDESGTFAIFPVGSGEISLKPIASEDLPNSF